MQDNSPIPQPSPDSGEQPESTTKSPIPLSKELSEQQSRAGKRRGWIISFFSLAILLEIFAMLLMTWMRYRYQGLSPDYTAFDKTANLYGLLLALPFITTFFSGIIFRRLQTTMLGVVSLSIGSLSVALLLLLTALPIEDQPFLGVIYLGFKALGIGLLIALFGSRKRTLWRKTLIVAIFSPLFGTLAYTFVIASVLLDPVTPPPTEVTPRAEYDAGVILGAAVWSGDKPSPVFRERIYKGYELLEDGTVEFLVLTGGSAPNELTEAEVGKRELLKLGADPTRIVLEEETSSTVEQMLFIRDELSKQGWESFVIISDQFHLKRSLEICAFNNIRANGIPSESPLGPYNLAIYHLRESAALILYWMFGL